MDKQGGRLPWTCAVTRRCLRRDLPVFGLTLCCGNLEILNFLKPGAVHFHFALGPASYGAR